ncbi:hypothetical protein BaRGS_00019148, partial [Batillaria attramentaria]
ILKVNGRVEVLRPVIFQHVGIETDWMFSVTLLKESNLDGSQCRKSPAAMFAVVESRLAALISVVREDSECEGDSSLPMMHQAAASGDVRLLVDVVQHDPSMLEQHNADGLTPLGQAVLSQQMGAVKRLVKMGANINAQDSIGRTCLSIAAYQGWHEGVVFLLRNGARQNISDKSGRHPIHAATYDKDPRTLMTLLPSLSSTEINHRDNELMTALHWAAFHNRPEHLRLLIERGSDVMASDIDGKVPLHWAAQNGSLECCRLLVEREDGDRMVTSQDHTGKTAIHFAAAAGHAHILRLLSLTSGCDMDAEDPDDRTPLHWAAAMGHVHCVRVLLELGAKADAVDVDGGTALGYATQSGHAECATILEQALNMSTGEGERNRRQLKHMDNPFRRGKNPLGFLKGLFARRRDCEPCPSLHESQAQKSATAASAVTQDSHGAQVGQPDSELGNALGAGHATSGRDQCLVIVETRQTVTRDQQLGSVSTVTGASPLAHTSHRHRLSANGRRNPPTLTEP